MEKTTTAWSKMISYVRVLVKHYGMGNVSDSAVVVAYYTLLSIFPAVLVVGNLLPLFNIDSSTVLSYLQPIFPKPVFDTLNPIISSFLDQGNGGVLSIGAVVTVWSASRAIAALQRTINGVYGVAKNQNAIINRLISFVWMLLLVASMMVLVLFFSFGQLIVEELTPILHLSTDLFDFIGQIKWPLTFSGVFILLLLLLYFVPQAQIKWRFVWPGAVVATLGWLLLSQGFSLYVRYFARSVTSYKTIGTVIVLLFWLDFSAIILLFGAVLNSTVQEIFSGHIQERNPRLNSFVRQQFKKRHDKKRKAPVRKAPTPPMRDRRSKRHQVPRPRDM